MNEIKEWLLQHGIISVAMESTSVYWIPLFQILESAGIKVCLVNAKYFKNVPGRGKTDRINANGCKNCILLAFYVLLFDLRTRYARYALLFGTEKTSFKWGLLISVTYKRHWNR
ncbi:MAG: transposase [Candidatus Brocadiae bacterium]|nr:transposase [Candidatus Brocadiia bacterium]